MAGTDDEVAAGAGGGGHLRATHVDRERVTDTLKAAFVQGMLTKDELDARVGQTFASRTYAELAAVTADIPAGLTTAKPPAPARAQDLHFGMTRSPRPVRDAVRYMCAGAVLNLAVLVTVVVTLGSVRSAAVQDLFVQWHTVMLTQVVPVLASAPIGAGLWLWLAWANGRGYNWARFAFAALFGLLTVGLLFVLAEGGDGQDAFRVLLPDLIAAAALWLAGLVAVVLIFSETASPYYQRRAATRAATPANGTGR
jgi:Domain of unknown function (DUF1707)